MLISGLKLAGNEAIANANSDEILMELKDTSLFIQWFFQQPLVYRIFISNEFKQIDSSSKFKGTFVDLSKDGVR